MKTPPLPSFVSRRRFLGGAAALGASAWTVPGAFAELASLTPRMTEGPFYPDRLPLDTDNDLIVVNDGLTPAVGEITHLSGRILTASGEPLRNAVIEIWQVDAHGAYLHSRTNNADGRDTHFQGFGRFLTGADGAYYFRTIKPVVYPGRTPHIHFLVRKGDRRLVTSQFFIKGQPENQRDGVLSRIDPKLRELVTIDFKPLPGSSIGELTAHGDVIVGLTPEEAERDGRRRG
ncbi:Protocatechuate 3,4-dioxygenase beta chain [Pirellulimonas nuda]|uniref:Protocatechuate 3,4-dioxygenase beta chain n=1 Tax=Pirellulimonas nuda TaxID=2528009 RepID=A0A518D6H3_9BACT|nr:protocatechuate 3,4-dioxygenase [Pirellulimonas nuda]QDU87077.1 Protocatechuate 3,4-dioxygenase beta chain [Pirellulimonas nuda]